MSTRSFERYIYRMILRCKLGNDIIDMECTGTFVCSFNLRSLSACSTIHAYLPRPFVSYDIAFEYDTSSPITEVEFSNRCRSYEDVRRVLLKEVIFRLYLEVFTTPYNINLLNRVINGKK